MSILKQPPKVGDTKKAIISKHGGGAYTTAPKDWLGCVIEMRIIDLRKNKRR